MSAVEFARDALIALFCMVFALAIGWWILELRFFRFLRKRHPAIHATLSDPVWFLGWGPFSDFKLMHFLWHRDDLPVGDAELSARTVRLRRYLNVFLALAATLALSGGIVHLADLMR
jgi:hypothetical protein